MHGTLADPKELEPLRHLTGLRELFLPARVWSPASDIKAPYSDEVFDFFSGMKHLERFQAGLTTLAWLDLWDAGLVRMAPLAQLKDLRVLSLSRSRLTNAGLAQLQQLPHLEMLDVRYTGVNRSGVEAVRASRPDCKVAFVSFSPPGASARGNERPKSTGQKALAAWIRALGGDARVADCNIQSISLARTNFTDA